MILSVDAYNTHIATGPLLTIGNVPVPTSAGQKPKDMVTKPAFSRLNYAKIPYVFCQWMVGWMNCCQRDDANGDVCVYIGYHSGVFFCGNHAA